MRNLNAAEVAAVAGADAMGDAMIRLGTGLQNDGDRVSSLPGGKAISPALDRTGRQFIDAGYRHNDTTSGGPPGGGPSGN